MTPSPEQPGAARAAAHALRTGVDISDAHLVVKAIPKDKQAVLATAHERYMYFTGVYTDRPEIDHLAEDRATFPHLLKFAADGRPSLSDERCAAFMAAVTGLPREWCGA